MDPGLGSASFLDGSGMGSLLKKSCDLSGCSTISVGGVGRITSGVAHIINMGVPSTGYLHYLSSGSCWHSLITV